MTPIKPMLASPMKKVTITNWTDWAVEEKFDGHRLIVYVNRDYDVQAYARPRGDGRMIERELAPGLREQLAKLPDGVYDGELIGGETSTDVSRLDLRDSLTFVVFDILQLGEHSCVGRVYSERRQLLETMFSRVDVDSAVVRLADSFRFHNETTFNAFVKGVWKRGGEGAILKRRTSMYHAGKRNGDWLKKKRQEHASLTIIGFEATKGTVMNRGPFAKVRLRDDDGNVTSCKTRDDYELDQFRSQYAATKYGKDHPLYIEGAPHPAIGRRLVIEFQQRTRDGGYRGPVLWDRWEDE